MRRCFVLLLALSCVLGQVVVNEVSDKGAPAVCDEHDWIELYNRGQHPVDLSGFRLSDDKGEFRFGSGSCTAPAIPAGGFLALCKDAACSFEFGIRSDDTISLHDSDGLLMDSTGPMPATGDGYNVSYGRYPDGEATFSYMSPTFNSSNVETLTTPKVFSPAAIKINEVAGKGAQGACSDNDWIELYNVGTESVNLTGFLLVDDFGAQHSSAFEFGLSGCAAPVVPPGELLTLCWKAACSFTFKISGEDKFTLFDELGRTVDATSVLEGGAFNRTFARIPDGHGEFQLAEATFGALNAPRQYDEADAREPAGLVDDGTSPWAFFALPVSTAIVLPALSYIAWRCFVRLRHPVRAGGGRSGAYALLPALCDAVVVLDSELQINEPSPAFANLMGLPADDVKGRHFTEFMSSGDGDRLKAHLRAPSEDKGSDMARSLNITLEKRPCGEEVHVTMYTSVCHDRRGDRYFLGICLVSEPIGATSNPHQGTIGVAPTASGPCFEAGSLADESNVDSRLTEDNIVSAFGTIEAQFDGMSPKFPILQFSRSFAALHTSACKGTLLLDLIIDRDRFEKWVQERVNNYLTGVTTGASESLRITMRVKNESQVERRLSVSCALIFLEESEPEEEDLETACEPEIGLMVCARLSRPKWESVGFIAKNPQGNLARSIRPKEGSSFDAGLGEAFPSSSTEVPSICGDASGPTKLTPTPVVSGSYDSFAESPPVFGNSLPSSHPSIPETCQYKSREDGDEEDPPEESRGKICSL